jgi:hypothetical protein
MKKIVLEMFFLNDPNFLLEGDAPRLVYRHCSSIPFYKIKRLAEKIENSIEKLLIDGFVRLLFDYFEENKVTVINRIDGTDCAVWEGVFIKDKLYTLTKKIKKKIPEVDKLAIKFEIKIVKYKILFSFYYPEDFSSDKFSMRMVYDYEKILRKMLKRIPQANENTVS